MTPWTIALVAFALVAFALIFCSSVVCAWALCRIAARADERMENIQRREAERS